ncbi:alpha/beta hydrolase family protein [Segetibacter koreensis]|uniref:alpha/beta hydrolase family protein n=1 Tax=Segetibacter koreensis TaxID=398037 RepID=UPI000688F290|nr:CocE/NonD family hydrolase [Segetibacter koreensis]
MLKCLLGLLIITICGIGCASSVRQNEQSKTDSMWSLPKSNLNTLPGASYKTLTQVYDDYMLENRDVTLRDERLLTMKDVNTVFDNMPVYKTVKEWEERKQYLKEHILVSAGLWPMPDKTPLNPKYYHKIDHDDYVVETVTIETYPGFLLAGNLYHPKGKGPYPAILTPHGHFPFGRLNNDSINSIPARCITMARQGYVVFSYDMVGYNDTRQAPHNFGDDSISHLYGINLLGLQLWNSIRALDFLTSLPSIDTGRVGITGASGGGTQVFLLTAVDDRFNAAAPVNMVSNTMQGGDICENAPGLRRNTYNVEIAAMVAPKPLLLVSDTYDWTFNTRNTIMPRMKSFYQLYNAENRVKNAHYDYEHNYNKASRGAVYEFFGKWLLHENDVTKLREKPFVVDSDSNLLAFMNHRDADRIKTFEKLSTSQYHDAPKMDEKGLKALMKNMYATQLNQNWPKDKNTLEKFKTLYQTSINHLLDVSKPDAIDCKIMSSAKGKNFTVHQLLIARKDKNDWIPCTLYQPFSATNSTVIVTADEGKNYWVKEGLATPNDLIIKLLNQKCSVLAPDLFKQGEHILQDSTKTQRVENDKLFTTYNLTDRQEQIQDILTIIKAISQNNELSHTIDLYAVGNTGITGLLLASITSDLHRIVLDGNHFDATIDQNMLTLQVPGIMRIGGLKTVMALAANKRLLLYNANPSLKLPEVPEVSKLENNENNFSVKTDNIGVDQVIDFLKH